MYVLLSFTVLSHSSVSFFLIFLCLFDPYKCVQFRMSSFLLNVYIRFCIYLGSLCHNSKIVSVQLSTLSLVRVRLLLLFGLIDVFVSDFFQTVPRLLRFFGFTQFRKGSLFSGYRRRKGSFRRPSCPQVVFVLTPLQFI